MSLEPAAPLLGPCAPERPREPVLPGWKPSPWPEGSCIQGQPRWPVRAPAPRSTSGLCFLGPPRPPMSSFHSCPSLPGEFRVSSDNSQVKDFPALNDFKKSTSKGGRARSSKCPTGLLEYEKHSCLQRFCLGEADVCELLGKHGSQGTWLCTLTHTSHIGVRTL